MDPTLPIDFLINEKALILKTAERKLKRLCQKISTSDPNLKCSFVVSEKSLSDSIMAVLQPQRGDLIVMGTQGAHGVRAFISGSHTAQIIEKAKCPVIAVPDSWKFKMPERIVFASNLHESDPECLKQLSVIAKSFSACLTVLHISPQKQLSANEKHMISSLKKTLKSEVKNCGINIESVHGSDTEETLQKYVHENKTDLLAMATHDRGILDKLFGTSLTRKMAHHSDIPVMAFHYRAESVFLV
jgi:nucleotide-binding universal stress UspA family protein